MGMFDSFWVEFTCPWCGTKDEHEVQTKMFGCHMQAFRQGDMLPWEETGYNERLKIVSGKIETTTIMGCCKEKKKVKCECGKGHITPEGYRWVALEIDIQMGLLIGVKSVKKLVRK